MAHTKEKKHDSSILHHSVLPEQLQQHAKHQMENLFVYMVIEPTPYQSIYKFFLGVILIHYSKNSILK